MRGSVFPRWGLIGVSAVILISIVFLVIDRAKNHSSNVTQETPSSDADLQNLQTLTKNDSLFSDSDRNVRTPDQQEPVSIEDLVDKLGRPKTPAEADEAVASLSRQGPAAVEEIGRQMAERPPDYQRLHHFVRVLKEVNSDRARELLRQLALGKFSGGNPNLESWAAQALISCDHREAWQLLSSTSPNVLGTSLNAVKGQPVDEQSMKSLKQCLQSKDALVSWRAAEIMAEDAPAGELANVAVDAIGQALANVSDIPGVSAPDPRAKPSISGPVQMLGEMYYRRYTLALANAHVDNRTLYELSKRLKKPAQDAVLLALAQRGDKSVHKDIIKVAQEGEGMFRAWAATALGKIGTTDDLPILRKLAETDPLVREGPSPPPNPRRTIGPRYIVREAAKAAIDRIEKQERKGSEK